MIILSLIDTTTIAGIIVFILAALLCFLALRQPFLWLLAAAAWAGVIALWSNQWIQYIAIGLAILCAIFFAANLTGAKVNRRGRY